ncbi:MAG: PKD domain-containing protein [Bacteroidota bacterium]
MKNAICYVASLVLLTVCCKDPPITTEAEAEFSFSVDKLEVTFTNLSVNAEYYEWNFQDGNYSSTEENPVHIFPRTGVFPVMLIAKSEDMMGDTMVHDVEVFRRNENITSEYTFESPYKNYANWYRGQLHVHCTASYFGQDPPDVMVETYRELGYDFISLTDHSVNTSDPGVEGILYIPGEEVHASLDGLEVHMNAYNINSTIPDGVTSEELISMKDVICQLNHPARSNVIYHHLDNAGAGLWGIEISNWYDKMEMDLWLWDNQISQEKRIWCNAADDMTSAANAGHNATIVNSETNSASDIHANLIAGNFYATEGGPDFVNMDITLEGNTIYCSTTNGNCIIWYKHDLQMVKKTYGQTDSYTPKGNEVFIRIEVQSDSDDDGDGIPNTAYSQPIFLIYQ